MDPRLMVPCPAGWIDEDDPLPDTVREAPRWFTEPSDEEPPDVPEGPP